MNASTGGLAAAMVAMAGSFLGCAGGKVLIVADHINYPVSTTSTVFGPTGGHANPSNGGMRIVGHFKMEWRQWSILWTLVPMSDEIRDLSPELTEHVERNKGHGVVNLSVVAKADPFFLVTSLIPVLPSHILVTVEGDVFCLEEPVR